MVWGSLSKRNMKLLPVSDHTTQLLTAALICYRCVLCCVTLAESDTSSPKAVPSNESYHPLHPTSSLPIPSLPLPKVLRSTSQAHLRQENSHVPIPRRGFHPMPSQPTPSPTTRLATLSNQLSHPAKPAMEEAPWNPDRADLLPTRKSLPKIPGAPDGAAWFWGKDDNLGRLNLLTPARVKEAAGEIRTGEVVTVKCVCRLKSLLFLSSFFLFEGVLVFFFLVGVCGFCSE